MSNLRAVANSNLTTRNRTKVYCYCKICNGNLVDSRMKKNYELKHNNSYTNSSGNNYQEVEEAGNILMECEPVPKINVPLSNITGQAPEVAKPLFEKTHSFLTKKVPIHESEKYQKIKKGKISDLVLENLLPNNERNKNNDRDKGLMIVTAIELLKVLKMKKIMILKILKMTMKITMLKILKMMMKR